MKAATNAALQNSHDIDTVDVDESATTTLRVPTELRNSLKKIAYLQGETLRDLTIAILTKHVSAYEAGIKRSLASLNRRGAAKSRGGAGRSRR